MISQCNPAFGSRNMAATELERRRNPIRSDVQTHTNYVMTSLICVFLEVVFPYLDHISIGFMNLSSYMISYGNYGMLMVDNEIYNDLWCMTFQPFSRLFDLKAAGSRSEPCLKASDEPLRVQRDLKRGAGTLKRPKPKLFLIFLGSKVLKHG